MSPSSLSPKSKDKKLIIFDFDGVLADSFDTFYPLMRDVMKHVDLSLTKEQYSNFFIDNVHQSIKNFIGNNEKYIVAMKFRNSNYNKYYYDKYHGAKLFPGAIKLLRKVERDYVLTIASSGKQNNIKKLLEENDIKNLFGMILASTATSKEGMIDQILNKFNAERKETTMVSDTVGDIKIAKKLGLKTIATTWGFQTIKTLTKSKPSSLVRNFDELSHLLTRLQSN